MTTHLTKIWWDLNKDKLVEQLIPESEIYKREWVGLTDEEIEQMMDYWSEDARSAYGGAHSANGEYVYIPDIIRDAEARLKEKNNG